MKKQNLQILLSNHHEKYTEVRPKNFFNLRGIANRIDYIEEVDDEEDEEDANAGAAANPGAAANAGAPANPGAAANAGAVPINGAALEAALAAANADPDVYIQEVHEVAEDEDADPLFV